MLGTFAVLTRVSRRCVGGGGGTFANPKQKGKLINEVLYLDRYIYHVIEMERL